QSDMVAPFRLHLTLAAIALSLLIVPFRQHWLFALAALALAGTLGPVAERMIARRTLPAHAPGRAVSVVSANVLCDNRQFDRVLAMARVEAPDLFIATETTPEWIAHLDALKARYPYRFHAGPGIFGIAAYARKPFVAQVFRIGRHKMPLGRLEFDDMVVLVGHSMPPVRAGLTAENREYLEALARLAEASSKPVILAGDLNATLWSHNMTPLLRAEMQWPSGSGLTYTWPVGRPHMAIQIDHILTRGAVAGAWRVLPGVGSDHYPVRADLVFSG
ncbi:MAG TPA: endonuclease/exonuclease/phosphatase family protein, partial [Rhizomicrobium sp.]|nr:endonuclease/exonuclease/phosphatase family protein [Rhizomicrobium sp.]